MKFVESVELYTITLKDSDKVIQYCDIILKSLPEFQVITKERKSRLELLHRSKVDTLVKTSVKIREKMQHYNESIQNNKRLLDQLPKQINETNRELENLTVKAEEYLLRITGNKLTLSR